MNVEPSHSEVTKVYPHHVPLVDHGERLLNDDGHGKSEYLSHSIENERLRPDDGVEYFDSTNIETELTSTNCSVTLVVTPPSDSTLVQSSCQQLSTAEYAPTSHDSHTSCPMYYDSNCSINQELPSVLDKTQELKLEISNSLVDMNVFDLFDNDCKSSTSGTDDNSYEIELMIPKDLTYNWDDSISCEDKIVKSIDMEHGESVQSNASTKVHVISESSSQLELTNAHMGRMLNSLFT
jgi:hypothetical protein